jgi:hypothetical protein
VTLEAREPPGGHGWHSAHKRVDGKWGRWTRDTCSFAAIADIGAYQVEIDLFGAVSERAIRDLSLSDGHESLDVEVARTRDGKWCARAIFRRHVRGIIDLCIAVPDANGGYGLEVEAVRFIPIDEGIVALRQSLGEYLRTLRGLESATRHEDQIVRCAMQAIHCFASRNGFPKPTVPPARAARDMFAGFAAVIEVAATQAAVARHKLAPWDKASRSHCRYAIERLENVECPPMFAPISRLSNAFEPLTPEFTSVLWEAACNIVSLLIEFEEIVKSET